MTTFLMAKVELRSQWTVAIHIKWHNGEQYEGVSWKCMSSCGRWFAHREPLFMSVCGSFNYSNSLEMALLAEWMDIHKQSIL